ncbi:GntR family transcriptional regulator [Rathayibacter sp. KR2-224]|uniref:GntR family transcriptional regulator n=1 Tax=Rathayibacter sp. KR2-224 TaxID=3400913 RepID=UPI003BFD154B
MLANVLSIDPSLPSPLYEQLRDQLIAQIGTGELAPGDKLPSVRRLASDLELAPNTVARVYKELESAGYLQTQGRNGTTVAEDLTGNETHRKLAELTSDYLKAMAPLGFNTERTIAYLQRHVAHSGGRSHTPGHP